MLYWIVFLLFSLFFAHISTDNRFDKKIREIAKLLLVISVIIFSGFRDGLGEDYEGYYINLVNGGYLNITFYEPLLSLIANLIYYTKLSPIFFFIFCAVITNVLFINTFYRYENAFIIIFIYLTGTIFFFNTFNLVRQMFAASIFMYSVRFIEDKKFIKYLICILIAYTMHFSSIYLIPIYFLVNRVYSHTIYFIILIASIILGQIITIDLTSILSRYINAYEVYFESEVSYSSGLLTLFFNLYLLFFIIYRNKIFIDSKNTIVLNLFFIAVILYNMISLFFYLYRFSIYFIIFAPIVIPLLGKVIGKYKSDIILILVFGIMMFIFLYNGIDNNIIVPNRILPLSSIFD